MASHFQCIGIDITDKTSLREWLVKAGKKGTWYKIEDSPDLYSCWKMGEGIEFWIGVNVKENRFGCYAPYFSTSNRTELNIVKEEADNDCEFCRGYCAMTDAGPPLIFSTPNSRMVRSSLKLPSVQQVELCAFAEGIKYFKDEEAYYQHQPASEPITLEKSAKIPGTDKSLDHVPGMSVDYFIPAGVFSPTQKKDFRQSPHALFAGKIEKAREIKNPITDNRFYHLTIDNYIGTIDVVCYSKSLETKPKKDGVIDGAFYFSGKDPMKGRLHQPFSDFYDST